MLARVLAIWWLQLALLPILAVASKIPFSWQFILLSLFSTQSECKLVEYVSPWTFSLWFGCTECRVDRESWGRAKEAIASWNSGFRQKSKFACVEVGMAKKCGSAKLQDASEISMRSMIQYSTVLVLVQYEHDIFDLAQLAALRWTQQNSSWKKWNSNDMRSLSEKFLSINKRSPAIFLNDI